MINEGTILIQHFSHFLFFLELAHFDLHSELEAGFINEKKRIFFSAMLNGDISLYTEDAFPIIIAKSNTCYVTYSRKGKFSYKLEKGNYLFFYICPRTAWLKRNEKHYPLIGKFLQYMKVNRKFFDHMPSCAIDQKMYALIETLFHLKNWNQTIFEANILKSLRSILDHYQFLLDAKFANRPYLLKDYLEKHYHESINNKVLAALYFTTEKTLIKSFKKEFTTTPYQYLIKIRMEQARNLLLYTALSPMEVYNRVGYSDFQSFRKQFKKHFGFPPSECR
ncbi:hypothetical protein GCM10009120_04590 [Sphingobacterium siyangense subsp. cladoniae]